MEEMTTNVWSLTITGILPPSQCTSRDIDWSDIEWKTDELLARHCWDNSFETYFFHIQWEKDFEIFYVSDTSSAVGNDLD